ncbi:MAG: hypothetical protein Q9162_006825 [Coniocarpon cinnabarinum]
MSESQSSTAIPFTQLPTDIILEICSHVDVLSDVANLCLINRAFYKNYKERRDTFTKQYSVVVLTDDDDSWGNRTGAELAYDALEESLQSVCEDYKIDRQPRDSHEWQIVRFALKYGERRKLLTNANFEGLTPLLLFVMWHGRQHASAWQDDESRWSLVPYTTPGALAWVSKGFRQKAIFRWPKDEIVETKMCFYLVSGNMQPVRRSAEEVTLKDLGTPDEVKHDTYGLLH